MKSVRNSLAIFEEIARNQPINVTSIAAATGLPYASAHRAVATLHDSGWIAPGAPGAKTWAVSERFHALARRSSSRLVERAAPILADLRDVTGESVSLSVPDGDEIEIVFHVDGVHALRVVDVVGVRAPVHASAVGKAILARASPDERHRFAHRRLPTYTETTITSPDAFLDELDAVAARGYSVVRGEWEPSVSAVGAAVIGPAGNAVAGIGVSGPTDRFDEAAVAATGSRVVDAASRLTLALCDIEEVVPSPVHHRQGGSS